MPRNRMGPTLRNDLAIPAAPAPKNTVECSSMCSLPTSVGPTFMSDSFGQCNPTVQAEVLS